MQRLQDDLRRQSEPLRQFQQIQDLVKQNSLGQQMRGSLRQVEPLRHIWGMPQRMVIPKYLQDVIGSTSIATLAQRLVAQPLPQSIFPDTGRNNEALLKAASLAFDTRALSKAAGLVSVVDLARQLEPFLKPMAQQPAWLERLQRHDFDGLLAQNFARQLEQVHPTFRAMEEARKSLAHLWPTLQDIDLDQFEVDDSQQQEAAKVVQDVAQSAANKADLQAAVSEIVAAIEAQQHPAVKVLLWLSFKKMLDILINAAVGAVMGYYVGAYLAKNPQAATKAVNENARKAVGSPELLMEYRYVSAKVLVARQNPRARSPQVGRLTFGKAVRLIKKDKGFALVAWSDQESDAEVQGWVFARYLEKFR